MAPNENDKFDNILKYFKSVWFYKGFKAALAWAILVSTASQINHIINIVKWPPQSFLHSYANVTWMNA